MYVVVAGVEHGTAPVGHLGMFGAPPVEHDLAVLHLLQITHGTRLTIDLTLDIGCRGNVMGVIPMPKTNFEMMALEEVRTIDWQRIERMKTWAFKLDTRFGELPFWPLVKRTLCFLCKRYKALSLSVFCRF